MEKCNGINDMAMINGRQLSKLMAACYHGNPHYVQDILGVPGIKIDLQSDKGRHALTCACALGHTEVAQLILNAYPNPQHLVNMQINDGTTALMLASINGHAETALLLLLYEADVNI